MVSPCASTTGLPCSMVITGAISAARERMMSAALRISLYRSNGEILRQVSKPALAASSARSRSAREACGVLPIGWPVAGLRMSSDLPDEPSVHSPAMNI